MPLIQIRRHDNGTVLFEGQHKNARECLETAITEAINLNFADLRYANLQNATLDGAQLQNALMDCVNLSGANISECDLQNARFINAHLPDACLCESNLSTANFEGALFGLTDISSAILDRTIFSTNSSLKLNFRSANSMEDCQYKIHERTTIFSRPPVTMDGMDWPIALFDTHMAISSQIKTYMEWFAPRNDNTPSVTDGTAYIDRFVQMHRKMLLSVANVHTRAISAECNDAIRSIA
jgi:hypothetical protein